MIAELIALKAEFEGATGTPFDPPKKTKAKKKLPAAVQEENNKGKKVRGVRGRALSGFVAVGRALFGHLFFLL